MPVVPILIQRLRLGRADADEQPGGDRSRPAIELVVGEPPLDLRVVQPDQGGPVPLVLRTLAQEMNERGHFFCRAMPPTLMRQTASEPTWRLGVSASSVTALLRSHSFGYDSTVGMLSITGRSTRASAASM